MEHDGFGAPDRGAHVVKEFGIEAANRRIVRTVTTAAPAEVFPGIAHTALISPEERDLSDPFLLMSDDRIDGGHGARVGGAHPHAGIESATLLLEGSIKDGDAAPLQAGDLQWMTAGSGIVHDEAVIARGSVRLLQLWITLPNGRRWTAPGFQDVPLASLPIRREPGVVVRLYSGRSGALVSPTQNQVPVTLADFWLEAGSGVDQELPGSYSGFLSLLDGSVRVGVDELRAGQVGWLDRPGREGPSNVHLTAGDGGARVILYAGPAQSTPGGLAGPV